MKFNILHFGLISILYYIAGGLWYKNGLVSFLYMGIAIMLFYLAMNIYYKRH